MVANIWVAAADNDINQVQQYLSNGQYTANSKDPNGYTAIHAAASYGNIELLRLLINNYGGDINIQDNDGDTPLHHCEELSVARLLVEEFKADWRKVNGEGKTAAVALEEDGEYVDIAEYLKSLSHDPSGKTFDSQQNKNVQTEQQQSNNNNNSINSGEHTRNGGLGDLLLGLSDEDKKKIKFTLEDANKLSGEIDEAQSKKLEEIVNGGEFSEEKLREFVKQSVHQNLQKLKNEQDGDEDEEQSKKRKT